MTRPLTPRQQNVYDFIVKTMNEFGYPPTRAEIAKALGFRSPNAAEEHLRALERKGVIRVIRGTSRGIRLPLQESEPSVGASPPTRACPLSVKSRPAAPSWRQSTSTATARFPRTISPLAPTICCGCAGFR